MPTEHDLLEDLEAFTNATEPPYTREKYSKWGQYSQTKVERVFGSWLDALREIGAEITTRQLANGNAAATNGSGDSVRLMFRTTPQMDENLEHLVEIGIYPNKSEALRDATRKLVWQHTPQKVPVGGKGE